MHTLRLVLLVLTLIFTSIVGCDSAENHADSDILNANGTMKAEGMGFLIEMSRPPEVLGDGPGPFWLYPLNLPEHFREDGLPIIFSANIEECDDGLFMYSPAHYAHAN